MLGPQPGLKCHSEGALPEDSPNDLITLTKSRLCKSRRLGIRCYHYLFLSLLRPVVSKFAVPALR